jgi:hypothetical protein
MSRMQEHLRRLWRSAPLMFALALLSSPARAEVLFPGARVALFGTKSAWRAELPGVVKYDRVKEFKIMEGEEVVYEGKIQIRVVRSNLTGRLHFYYRIRDTVPGGAGAIIGLDGIDFADWSTDVDYRLDGLGTKGPPWALRSPEPGSVVRFSFSANPIFAGEDSRFCFIMTDAEEYAEGGTVTIIHSSGARVTVPAVQPVEK